tara:strand:- start:457 stop:672 length:216 start_codon:yes stop_codon:yes gene_type:complete
MMQIEKDIRYFKEYRKSLIQFIIINSCYDGTYWQRNGKVKIKAKEMLGLLEEISRIEKFIAKLEMRISGWN